MHRKMKRIMQKYNSDCGIACIAMLTGRNYSAVKRALEGPTLDIFEPKTTRDLALQETYLRFALLYFKIRLGRWIEPNETQKASNKTWEKLINDKQRAIVMIKKGKKSHWVVFDRTGVRDPWKGIISDFRTDFARMRIEGYACVK